MPAGGPERPAAAPTAVRPRRRRRWLTPRSYPTLVLLPVLGLVAACLAWMSAGLLALAMSNVDFLQRHGTRAVAEGGLLQLTQIGAQSIAVLLLYLAFRGIEVELVARWVGRPEE